MPRITPYLWLLAGFAISCAHGEREFSAPNYNPHILQSTAYIPAQGIKINRDSVAAPTYTPAQGKYVEAGQPQYVQVRSNNRPAAPPQYVPAQGQIINMDSVDRPKFFPVRGEHIRAGWPEWKPVQLHYKGNAPFAYLAVENGLYSPFVKHLIEDQFGRIWLGHHGGTMGVWDGRGYVHYTREEGLMLYSGVFSILEDRNGHIWTGGERLSRWNGVEFIDYGSLHGGGVNSLLEDQEGQIWIGTSEGLKRWTKEGFLWYTTREGLVHNEINSLLEDRTGHIWIGTNGGLSTWNGEAFTNFTSSEGLSADEVRSLALDTSGQIWIATGKGLNVWDGQGFLHYTEREGLSNNDARRLLADRNGRIWIETDTGLDVWDGAGFRHYTLADGLSNNGPYAFLEDRAGHIWIGTDGGGASIYGWKDFDHFTIAEGLSDNFVSSVLEDRQGHIWIGTRGGGINVWDGSGFLRYTEAQGLSDDFVRCLVMDDLGRIWIGTDQGGISVWDGNGFTYYTTEEGLSANNVWSLFKDSAGQIWIGMNGTGVDVWDGKGFTKYTTAQGLATNHAYSFEEDRQGRIWIGTYGGISVWDGEGFTLYTENEGLGDNRIWSLLKDQNDYMWIGTNQGGVNVWDGNGFYQYTEAAGLSQDIGRSLSQDQLGNIWIGTFKGLNLLQPTANASEWVLHRYYQADGLTGISINATFLDRRNRLWVATSEGLNWLDLDRLPGDSSRPTIFLRDLQPFFEFVDWRQVRDSLDRGAEFLNKPQEVSLTGIDFDSVQAFTNLPVRPEFPHSINDLTFHWNGAHEVSPHKLLYSYVLEGNDDAWSPPLPDTRIRLQNLQPGHYTFKVRAVGINGQWSDTAAYPFTIRPPWWATHTAYISYMLIILLLFYGLYRFQLNRRLVEAEARRLRELDAFKSNLYTNITHEFRTPLTVIMGMADEIRGQERIRQLIRKNSQDLLQLVNQMLDLRKLEISALQLNLVQGNIIPFLRYLAESFHSTAAAKNIRLFFHAVEERLVMDYDPERVRQVVANLLGNALKFTPEGGEVSMSVDQIQAGPGEHSLSIIVKDNGIGIPAEQLPHIFDRFYQADHSTTRKAEGTGIGLALVRELVEAMGGSVSVKSEEQKGTQFLVRLPIRRTAQIVDDATDRLAERKPEDESTYSDSMSEKSKAAASSLLDDRFYSKPSDLPLALIIEDNKDVADYLTLCMQTDYQVKWARNGREGLEKALETVPDIIITDVMMPEMDGYELCRLLKSDERTSHIPIIMLTARATQEDRLSGLEKGADAYLVKPFDKAELQIRLQKLIELRRQLRQKYSEAPLETIDEGQESDPEWRFLKKLQTVVLEHLSDENFKVEPHLCRAMTMSRPQLYRKLKALKDLSPSEFIRAVRMDQARRLLRRGALSVGEVAEQVGFKDPSYFTKVYTATFGESPSHSNHQ